MMAFIDQEASEKAEEIDAKVGTICFKSDKLDHLKPNFMKLVHFAIQA